MNEVTEQATAKVSHSTAINELLMFKLHAVPYNYCHLLCLDSCKNISS
jgi:hypothetical protein